MPDRIKWNAPVPLPSGHRMFSSGDDPFKHVAIADNSGRTPESTDDGILWLDFEWPLMITSPDRVLSVPVKRERDDERFSTVVDTATLLYLSATFQWTIQDQDDNTYYTVRREN